MPRVSAPGRLLLDEMLAGLARLLRAGGHDVALAEAGTPDDAVAARAAAEGRTLATCDRAFADAVPGTVLLAPEGTDEQAKTLLTALNLSAAPAPFTRCVIDNTPVRRASEAERAAAPDGVAEAYACPACGRVFWAGSHVRRMTEQLAALDAYLDEGVSDRA